MKYNLDRYDESLETDNGRNPSKQKWVTISKIQVPTERDKEQLLEAFTYIHNLRNIDSDYLAVNTLMHMYQRPDVIEVLK